MTVSLQMAGSVAVMAVTNGYGSSVMMMYGPAKVSWFRVRRPRVHVCMRSTPSFCARRLAGETRKARVGGNNHELFPAGSLCCHCL